MWSAAHEHWTKIDGCPDKGLIQFLHYCQNKLKKENLPHFNWKNSQMSSMLKIKAYVSFSDKAICKRRKNCKPQGGQH